MPDAVVVWACHRCESISGQVIRQLSQLNICEEAQDCSQRPFTSNEGQNLIQSLCLKVQLPWLGSLLNRLRQRQISHKLTRCEPYIIVSTVLVLGLHGYELRTVRPGSCRNDLIPYSGLSRTEIRQRHETLIYKKLVVGFLVVNQRDETRNWIKH